MPFQSDNFQIVSEDLIAAVVALANRKAEAGYKVIVEPGEIHLPSTPALKLLREGTTIYVEPGSARIPERQIEDWVRYAQSCPSDTRIVYCCNKHLSHKKEGWLRARKVGLAVVENGNVVDQIGAHDLAMKMVLPPIGQLKAQLRRKLSTSYEKEGNGDWQAAFEEACKAFEVEARRYLIKYCGSGRIVLVASASGKTRTPTSSQINRMTIGALAKTFGEILKKNQLDSRIGDTLAAINRDRITVAHKKRSGEKRLRQNVGQHMWAIIGCMKEM